MLHMVSLTDQNRSSCCSVSPHVLCVVDCSSSWIQGCELTDDIRHRSPSDHSCSVHTSHTSLCGLDSHVYKFDMPMDLSALLTMCHNEHNEMFLVQRSDVDM